MPAKLKNLVIDRVDAVDKGANQEAHIVLTKRDDHPADERNDGQSRHEPAGDGTGHPDGSGSGARGSSGGASDSKEWADEYETSEEGHILKATLTSGARNALPDSAFAAVWSDKDGKK